MLRELHHAVKARHVGRPCEKSVQQGLDGHASNHACKGSFRPFEQEVEVKSRYHGMKIPRFYN